MAVARYYQQDNKIKKAYVKDVLPENNSRLPVIHSEQHRGDLIVHELAVMIWAMHLKTVVPAFKRSKKRSGRTSIWNRLICFLKLRHG